MVLDCFKSIAKITENPDICEEIKLWYENKLKDKEHSPDIIERLSKDFISECKKEVDDSMEFRSFEDLNEDELKEINELIDCKKFKFQSRSDYKLCESYVYNIKKIKEIANCLNDFKFDYEIANCLDINFPIGDLEDLEVSYQDPSCNFLDLKQNQSAIAGRVIGKGKTRYYDLYYIRIFNMHHPNVRSCGSITCESENPILGIEPGDGVYIIGDYLQWNCGGSICSRCYIKKVKKVFNP